MRIVNEIVSEIERSRLRERDLVLSHDRHRVKEVWGNGNGKQSPPAFGFDQKFRTSLDCLDVDSARIGEVDAERMPQVRVAVIAINVKGYAPNTGPSNFWNYYYRVGILLNLYDLALKDFWIRHSPPAQFLLRLPHRQRQRDYVDSTVC